MNAAEGPEQYLPAGTAPLRADAVPAIAGTATTRTSEIEFITMSVTGIRAGAATISRENESLSPEARPGHNSSAAPFGDRFHKLTAAAAEMIETSIASVAVLDGNAHSLSGRLGSFLRREAMEHVMNLHHLALGGQLVIRDLSKDGRTLDLPCVTDYPYLRFYAGVPIIVGGSTVGTLAVMDRSPRPDGICLLASAALSGFAACASLLWERPSFGVPRS